MAMANKESTQTRKRKFVEFPSFFQFYQNSVIISYYMFMGLLSQTVYVCTMAVMQITNTFSAEQNKQKKKKKKLHKTVALPIVSYRICYSQRKGILTS